MGNNVRSLNSLITEFDSSISWMNEGISRELEIFVVLDALNVIINTRISGHNEYADIMRLELLAVIALKEFKFAEFDFYYDEWFESRDFFDYRIHPLAVLMNVLEPFFKSTIRN